MRYNSVQSSADSGGLSITATACSVCAIAGDVGRGFVATGAGVGGRLAEWVVASDGAVMCYTHMPSEPAIAAVVVCPPLFLEASENYRAEMALAEALVARGIAVQRFDYRGCGNSHGHADHLTLASAEEDCLLAARRLCEHAGTDVVGLVGTRFGALVAAGAAGALGVAAIAVWEAKPDGRAYVDELVRTRAFSDLWGNERRPASFHQQRVAAGLTLDVVGWQVHPSLVASALGESVADRLARPLPVRLVHGRGRRADGERLTAELQAVGCPVTVRVLPDRVLWWVGTNRLLHPEHPRSPLEAEAEATAEWLAGRLAS